MLLRNIWINERGYYRSSNKTGNNEIRKQILKIKCYEGSNTFLNYYSHYRIPILSKYKNSVSSIL